MNMRNRFTHLLGAALALSAAICTAGAEAQVYPTQTPTYTPTALLAKTFTTTGDGLFTVQSLGEVNLTLTGTYSALTAAVRGTTSPAGAASPTWVTLGVIPVGSPASGKPSNTLTANGSWKVNATGWSQLQLHVTAFTGTSVTMTLSGTAVGFYHVPANVDLGALITNTAQAAATVSSPDQLGGDVTTVLCTFNQTANTAGNTLFKVEGKDAASGLYYTLIQSAAITTANNTPSTIAVGAGVATTANLGAGTPVPGTWRVTEVASGTSTTGTVGCNAH